MANIYLFTVNNKNTEKSVKRFNRFYNISIVSNVDFEHLFVCWEPNEIVNLVKSLIYTTKKVSINSAP